MPHTEPVNHGHWVLPDLRLSRTHPRSRLLRSPHKHTSSRARTPGAMPLTTQDIGTPAYSLPPSTSWELRDALPRAWDI